MRVFERTRVCGLGTGESGAVVHTDEGREIHGDVVVSAAGRWTEEVTGFAGAPVVMAQFSERGDASVGYLATTNPVPTRLDCLITSSRINVRPAGGGRLMLQCLDLDASAHPEDVPSSDSDLADTFTRRLRGLLANTGAARTIELCVGRRSLPGDALTVAGFLEEFPWLYVTATHSGLTLAPFLGEAIARELNGNPDERLASFRPGRLVGAERRVIPPSRVTREQ